MDQQVPVSAAQLDVLGGFRLSSQDQPMMVSRPAQRLLACLAVSRSPVPRTALSVLLWPDSDGARAASNLRSTLWRLPKPSGRSLVDTPGDRVCLGGHVGVDLWVSEASVRDLSGPGEDVGFHGSGERSHVDLAADLLPEWSDEWLVVEQESYRQLRLHALERLSDRLYEQGRFPAALHAALTAVRGDRLRESAHRRVISVHLAEGNPTEALRQFHAYRRVLAVELGLPPSPAIRELVQHLLGRPLDARTPAQRRRRQP